LTKRNIADIMNSVSYGVTSIFLHTTYYSNTADDNVKIFFQRSV